MSLQIAKFFNAAMRASSVVTAAVDGRIYPVSRPMEEDEEDKVPYIVIMPEALTNDVATKDDTESICDSVSVGILVCASDYADLVDLCQAVRDAIHDAWFDMSTDTGWNFRLDDYEFSADADQYDMMKPCYFKTLRYRCNTTKKQPQ